MKLTVTKDDYSTATFDIPNRPHSAEWTGKVVILVDGTNIYFSVPEIGYWKMGTEDLLRQCNVSTFYLALSRVENM